MAGLFAGAGGTRGGCMSCAGFFLFTTIILMIVAISTNYWKNKVTGCLQPQKPDGGEMPIRNPQSVGFR